MYIYICIYIYVYMYVYMSSIRKSYLGTNIVQRRFDLVGPREQLYVKNCSDRTAYAQYKWGKVHHTIFASAPQMMSQIIIMYSNHTIFVRALLLYVFKCIILCLLTIFKFRQHHVIQYGLMEFLIHFV